MPTWHADPSGQSLVLEQAVKGESTSQRKFPLTSKEPLTPQPGQNDELELGMILKQPPLSDSYPLDRRSCSPRLEVRASALGGVPNRVCGPSIRRCSRIGPRR